MGENVQYVQNIKISHNQATNMSCIKCQYLAVCEELICRYGYLFWR